MIEISRQVQDAARIAGAAVDQAQKTNDRVNTLGVDEDVRTLKGKCAAWSQDVRRELQTEDGQRILHNIKLLREHFEPEVMVEEASRSRRAKAAKGAYRARGDDAPFPRPLLP
ncbi:hypothetical protein ACVWXO_001824 [Bradyrhizobium sp. LM2.7]